LERQYNEILKTGRAFRKPIVKIGDKRMGTNRVSGGMAYKANGVNQILRFVTLEGFAKVNDDAEYEINVEKAGIYDIENIWTKFRCFNIDGYL
jgi:hypothetical protein